MKADLVKLVFIGGLTMEQAIFIENADDDNTMEIDVPNSNGGISFHLWKHGDLDYRLRDYECNDESESFHTKDELVARYLEIYQNWLDIQDGCSREQKISVDG